MGLFFSKSSRSLDLDNLLLQAASPDDPILTEAITEYRHNKAILEKRNDLNSELKVALLHSLDEELKLVEAKQHILALHTNNKKLQNINAQLKHHSSKIKRQALQQKNKADTLMLILLILLGTLLLVYLLSHIFPRAVFTHPPSMTPLSHSHRHRHRYRYSDSDTDRESDTLYSPTFHPRYASNSPLASSAIPCVLDGSSTATSNCDVDGYVGSSVIFEDDLVGKCASWMCTDCMCVADTFCCLYFLWILFLCARTLVS